MNHSDVDYIMYSVMASRVHFNISNCTLCTVNKICRIPRSQVVNGKLVYRIGLIPTMYAGEHICIY